MSATRDLHEALTEDDWKAVRTVGVLIGVTESGRVWVKHPNGYLGLGSSVGQALDNITDDDNEHVEFA